MAEGLLANASVVILFGAMIGAGIMKGIKEVREFRKGSPDKATAAEAAPVAAVTIMETASLAALTRSNKEVSEGIGRLVDCIGDLRDELRDTRRETAEVRHAIQDAQRGHRP